MDARGEAAGASDREIVLSRVFDAPRELVFRVWTDPEHVVRWWGPRGFTNTSRSMEVRPGGVWRYVMHGPDGRDYENIVTYLEVARPERLVYKHGGAGDTEPINFEVTVTFEEQGGGRTKVTMRSIFPSKAARDFVVNTYGALEGGKQHLEKLAEYLAEQARGASDGDFVITRAFHAPRETVFRAWTEAAGLGKWFGPKGVTIPRCTMDLRPGGVFHYCMRTPDGKDMWGKWLFREISPPERLVLVMSFSDEKRGITRHPTSPDWPAEVLTVVTFASHAGLGRGTVVTVRWSALNPTEAERREFDAGHAAMTQGWTGTLDKLAGYLAGS